MKILKDLYVFDKKVFVRGDLDVPLDNDKVLDVARLKNLLLTISYLKKRNCRIILAGHIGRPKKNQEFRLSTKILVPALTSILDSKIVHFATFPNPDFFKKTPGLKNGAILLLENLRFWEEEEKNDYNFSQQLSQLGDIYVNEAFAASHRSHASIVGMPKFLPHGAGLHFAKEVLTLSKILKDPVRPFVAIIGGAKIETKLPVIENLAKIADYVLIAGALPTSSQLSVVGNQQVFIAKLTENGKDMDANSIQKFKEVILRAKTLVWNGPLGIFEEKESEKGTKEIGKEVGKSSAFKVVGGGDTIFALKKLGLLDKMDWVSSGGGAMLEFLAKETLPGIEALK